MAAVRSRLVQQVYTIDPVEVVADTARIDLARAGATSVIVRRGDISTTH